MPQAHREPLGVLGAGWVGPTTAACFAELGHDVVVRDVAPERVAALNAGEVPIHEPGLASMLARNRDRIHFTADPRDIVAATEIVFVCVGTPSTHSGDADLSAVWRIVDELADVEEPLLLVMKSTVPVGTGEEVRARFDGLGLAHIGYVANPEFLAEGTALADFNEPDRVVVGAFAHHDGDRIAGLYEPLNAPIVRTDVASAEMIKLASNAALATRISFINDRERLRARRRRRRPSRTRRRARPSPGVAFSARRIGYGGSCFPKDALALKQLAANSGYHFQLLSAVIDVNELQKRRIIQEDPGAPGRPAWADRGDPRPELQAQHERHARGAQPRVSSPRARSCASGTRWYSPRRGDCLQGGVRRDLDGGGGRCGRGADCHRLARAP